MKSEISIATSVRYGNYKQFFDNAIFMAKTIHDNESVIRKHINLPRQIFYEIRPIRSGYGLSGKCTEQINGRNISRYRIQVDVRQTEAEFYDTLLHELVHIEQFYEKRLLDVGTQQHFKWKGEVIKFADVTYNEYIALPWEVEARKRAKKLTRTLFKL